MIKLNEIIKQQDLFEDDKPVVYSDDFLKKVKQFEKALLNKHTKISQKKTPRSKVKRDGQGFEYVPVGWMADQINKDFPMWSWCGLPGHSVQMGGEWVVTDGELEIVDNGIKRRFYSPGAARIQFKRGKPHTPENIVDMDNNVAAANSNAFKRAVNRLCNIADDIYRKQIDPLATYETLQEINKRMDLLSPEDQISCKNFLNEKGEDLLESEAQKLLERIQQLT